MMMFALIAAAVLLANPLITLLAESLANLIAAYHFWRSDRIGREILASASQTRTRDGWDGRAADRAQRRLLAAGLRSAVRITAHYGLYPSASLRGHTLAQALRAGHSCGR